MLFFIITIILVLTVVIICLIKVNVVIEYNRQGVNDNFVLSFLALKGLIKYKYEIPKIDVNKKGVKFKRLKERGKKEKDTSKKKGKMGYRYLIKKIETFRNFQKKYNVLLEKVYKYLRCRIKIRKIDINVVVGTDNAHHTAVLVGICWSAAGLLLSYIQNKLNLMEKTVNIKPDYMGKKFKVDLFCILSVRIGHIIVVGLISVIHIIGSKFGITEVRRSVAG